MNVKKSVAFLTALCLVGGAPLCCALPMANNIISCAVEEEEEELTYESSDISTTATTYQ